METLWKLGDPWQAFDIADYDQPHITLVTENGTHHAFDVATRTIVRVPTFHHMYGDGDLRRVRSWDVLTACGFIYTFEPGRMEDFHCSTLIHLLIAGLPSEDTFKAYADLKEAKTVENLDTHPDEPCGAIYCPKKKANK